MQVYYMAQHWTIKVFIRLFMVKSKLSVVFMCEQLVGYNRWIYFYYLSAFYSFFLGCHNVLVF